MPKIHVSVMGEVWASSPAPSFPCLYISHKGKGKEYLPAWKPCWGGDVIGMRLLRKDGSILTLVSTKGKSVFSGPLRLTCKCWYGWLCHSNCHLNCLLPSTTRMTTFCCECQAPQGWHPDFLTPPLCWEGWIWARMNMGLDLCML